jgi:hypothetical protein
VRKSSNRLTRPVCLPGWALAGVLLQACSGPPIFEFRGYTDQSGCRKAIDAELALGATFDGAYVADDSPDTDMITELTGAIYDSAFEIQIGCTNRGALSWVHYIADTVDPDETGQLFNQLADELVTRFGEPTEHLAQDSRKLHFVCDRPAPVVLEEYQLNDDEHEVYLAVIPHAARCIDSR